MKNIRVRIKPHRFLENLKIEMIVIYLLVMSGSVFQHSGMDSLQKINSCVAIIMSVRYLLKRGINFVVKKNILDIFMVLSAIGLTIIMVLWNDISGISGYVGIYSLLLVSYFISRRNDFEKIKNMYIDTILFIAFVSLVLFFGQTITSKLPYISLDDGNYKYYLIYAQFSNNRITVLNRNIGIFWEPGMYQGILIFTMLLIALKNEQKKNEIVKQIILTIAVISTQSTTGLILLPFVLFIYVMKQLETINKKIQCIFLVFVIGAFLIMFCTLDFSNMLLQLFPSEVGEKLTDVNNISRNTRFYNLIVDGTIIVRNPFGVPSTYLTAMRDNIRETLSAVTDSATTNSNLAMAINYGLIPGLLYLATVVKGCMNLSENRFVSLIALLIFLVVINTEPHYLCLLLNVFIFYYASRSETERNK